MAVSEASVAARLERLPMSQWHVRVRIVVGTATFFAGFDSFTLSIALPALLGPWHITPGQVGALISSSYAGYAVGAVLFGWISARIGRVNTLRICIALYGLSSLLCAIARNYEVLFLLRLIGGIGLGGEVPIAATYINEVAQAHRRGAFFLLYEIIFLIGLFMVAVLGAWIIPRFGWQSLFVVGALPAALAVFMQRYCPELPRWLASCGRLEEAERSLEAIERAVSKNGIRPLPAAEERPELQPARSDLDWREFLRGPYRRRTISVWVLWAATYMMTNTVSNWLPTLYRTAYHLSLQDTLNLARFAQLGGMVVEIICALTIDRVGRRVWFLLDFTVCTACCICFYLFGAVSLFNVIIFGWTFLAFASTASFSLYLYTTEIYPTRLRAVGVSVATIWARVAAFVGPLLVGWIIPNYGVVGLFVMAGFLAATSLVVTIWLVVEGKRKVLEVFSP